MHADELEAVLAVGRAVHREAGLREDGGQEGPDVLLVLDHDCDARFFHRCTFRRGESTAGSWTSVRISQKAVSNAPRVGHQAEPGAIAPARCARSGEAAAEVPSNLGRSPAGASIRGDAGAPRPAPARPVNGEEWRSPPRSPPHRSDGSLRAAATSRTRAARRRRRPSRSIGHRTSSPDRRSRGSISFGLPPRLAAALSELRLGSGRPKFCPSTRHPWDLGVASSMHAPRRAHRRHRLGKVHDRPPPRRSRRRRRRRRPDRARCAAAGLARARGDRGGVRGGDAACRRLAGPRRARARGLRRRRRREAAERDRPPRRARRVGSGASPRRSPRIRTPSSSTTCRCWSRRASTTRGS